MGTLEAGVMTSSWLAWDSDKERDDSSMEEVEDLADLRGSGAQRSEGIVELMISS